VPIIDRVSVPRIRLTVAVLDVLDVLMNASADDAAWGLRICEQTGLGTGTVYPVLDRLMKAGWITDRWETPAPLDRPRRRFYEMTPAGRAGYGAALEARAARRMTWAGPALCTGGVS
jgi:PadR family transcriptional regulator PadR